MMHPLRSILIAAAVLAAAAPDRAAAQSTEAPAQSTEAPLQIEEAPAQSVEEVQDLVVSDPFSPLSGDNGFADETETESEIPGLLETEMVYEVPIGILDGIEKDTPDGEAAQMSADERDALMEELCEANTAKKLWARHENISTSYRLFDESADAWKEYSCSYQDPLIYYSDDWTPGLEELRQLIYNGNSCVADYTETMHVICFLNASGTPYRDPENAPVTIDEDTKDEPLLKLCRSRDAVYVITQLTDSSIQRLGLDDPSEDGFYTCLYVLDPATTDVQLAQVSLHEDAHTVKDVRNITYSYDTGMSSFVENGYQGLLRHLMPGAAWEAEYLRKVTLTLDPGTDQEQVFSLTTLKGDPVSISLPDGYELYSDESLRTRWVDNGDYASDLNLWSAPE